MSPTQFSLKNNRLSLNHADWPRETFDISDEDSQILQACTTQYLEALEQRDKDHRPTLLAIGQQLATWLNRSSWLERLLDDVREDVWDVVFQVPVRPNGAETVFLNAPWELLVWHERHLALDDFTWFNPC